MSTLLSDLDSAGPSEDGDLVQKILSEMNGSPAPPANQIINAPNPNTVAPRVMDSGPATAHIIGGSHPTPADFAAAMHQQNSMAAMPSMPMASQQAAWAPVAPSPMPGAYAPKPQKSWITRISEEIKLPLFVVVLVFVFSLPVINVLFAHYLPSVVKPTGELTTIGLLIKSVAAGSSFWILQRVVVPLLSL
jgi:hypothetical protein